MIATALRAVAPRGEVIETFEYAIGGYPVPERSLSRSLRAYAHRIFQARSRSCSIFIEIAIRTHRAHAAP